MIVICALLKEHGTLIATRYRIVAHGRFRIETAVHEVTVEEYHGAVGKLRHVEGEMHHTIISLYLAVGSSLTPYEETSVLGLIVNIGAFRPLLVHIQIEVPVWILKSIDSTPSPG